MLIVLLLLLGFVALYFGAEWLVEGASDIASHLRLSKSFVGLTLVAFGTSAPELFVNVIAATRDHPALALSNIAGSNLTNLCIGFGLCSLFCVVPLPRRSFLVDVLFMLLAPSLVLGSFLLTPQPALSLWALIPFAIALAYYLYSLASRRVAAVVEDPTHLTLFKPVVFFVLGVVALYGGGELVFYSATHLASGWGVSETVVGLTIIACGTSIPDVTASVIASRRGEYEIAVGNLLGSNISNVLVVLGGTLIAARSPLPADLSLVVDYTVVCCLSVLFGLAVSRTERVSRAIGVSLIVAFLIYYTLRITSAVLATGTATTG